MKAFVPKTHKIQFLTFFVIFGLERILPFGVDCLNVILDCCEIVWQISKAPFSVFVQYQHQDKKMGLFFVSKTSYTA